MTTIPLIQNALPNGVGWYLNTKANHIPPRLPIAPTIPVIKPFDPGLQWGTREKFAPFAISSKVARMTINTMTTATAKPYVNSLRNILDDGCVLTRRRNSRMVVVLDVDPNCDREYTLQESSDEDKILLARHTMTTVYKVAEVTTYDHPCQCPTCLDWWQPHTNRSRENVQYAVYAGNLHRRVHWYDIPRERLPQLTYPAVV